MTTYFGYDPGLDENHGVASLEVDPQGRFQCTAMDRVPTADAALGWLSERIGAASDRGGLGIGAPTEWCLGSMGNRTAEDFLRTHYGDRELTEPNWLTGAMPLGGMGVLVKLRERWSDLLVTETHPRILYTAMSHEPFDFDELGIDMSRWLARRVDTTTLVGDTWLVWSEASWNALFSAWVCAEGMKSGWQDLHDPTRSKAPGTVVRPAGKTKFLWPTLSVPEGQAP